MRDKDIAKKLGIIKVKVCYGHLGDVSKQPIPSREPRDQICLAEKAMKGKALSHGTSYANAFLSFFSEVHRS
jgi:hypothetical protein